MNTFRILHRSLLPALLLLVMSAASSSWATTLTVTLEVTSSPGGAKVIVSGVERGVTPDDGGKLILKNEKIDDKAPTVLRVVKDGYAPSEVQLKYADAKLEAKGSFTKIWTLKPVTLAETRHEVAVLVTNTVAGAKVSVDGKEMGITPLATSLTFLRADGEAPWRDIKVRVEKSPQYKADEQTVRLADLTRGESAAGAARMIKFDLTEVQRTFQIAVTANEPDATVELDGKDVGRTSAKPLTVSLLFSREGSEPWPSHMVKVRKKDWEFRDPGQMLGKPEFSQTLSLEELAKVTGGGKSAYPVKVTLESPTHVITPIRIFEESAGKLQLVVTNAVSESNNKDGAQSAPAVFRSELVKEGLILSKMAYMPGAADGKDHIYFIQPKWQFPTDGSTNTPPQLVSANIFEATDQAKTPLRIEKSIDVDPFVTRGERKWLYYSSDRSTGFRHIWRISVEGQIGVQKITQDDGYIHLEPAVSPDSELLAYSARPVHAAPNVPFSIWLANPDGSNRREICEGRSPAWSEDGQRIAFVNQNKLFIMQKDGSDQREITGDAQGRVFYPVWSGNRYIYYCSDLGKDKAGNHQFDIYRVSAEKEEQPLQVTSNDSVDYAPMVVGKRLYFYSNRGATGNGNEALRICYRDLPPE